MEEVDKNNDEFSEIKLHLLDFYNLIKGHKNEIKKILKIEDIFTELSKIGDDLEDINDDIDEESDDYFLVCIYKDIGSLEVYKPDFEKILK